MFSVYLFVCLFSVKQVSTLNGALVSFPGAMVKYSDKANFKGELILVHGLVHHGGEMKGGELETPPPHHIAYTIGTQKTRKAFCSCLLGLRRLSDPNQGAVSPTPGDLLTSSNTVEVICHRHVAQRSISSCDGVLVTSVLP